MRTKNYLKGGNTMLKWQAYIVLIFGTFYYLIKYFKLERGYIKHIPICIYYVIKYGWKIIIKKEVIKNDFLERKP